MMKTKAMLVSLVVLAVVLTWTVSVSANLRPLDSAAAVSQRVLPLRTTRDVPNNNPPTVEAAIDDVSVNVNASDEVINLYDVFQDAEDADEDLAFTIQSGGDAAIFDGEPVIASGQLTLKFKSDTPGSATVSVQATDMGGLFAEDSFDVTVNTPPAAEEQYVVTDESIPAPITLEGNDDDGDMLTFEVVTEPSSGTLDDDELPEVTYTPDTDFHGSDSFTFRVFDQTDYSDEAHVWITVNPDNIPPTADSQNVETNENSDKSIVLTGSDLDGDTLTFAIVDFPGNGSLDGAPPNVTYTPNTNFHGTDSFTFKVNDGTVDSNIATVMITVNQVNTPPTANSQNVETNENSDKSIVLTGSDLDGDTLTFAIVDFPGNGSLDGAPPNVTYTPNTNFHGTDSFTFKVNDGTVDSNIATVMITVNQVNTPPTANSQTVETNEESAKPIVLTGSDLDGDTLTFAIVDFPGNGSLTGAPPNVTYTPNTNYNGSDSFTFKVNDGTVDSNIATVTIEVTPLNDAPVLDLNGGATGTGFSVTHAAGQAAVEIASNSLTITDPDNDEMQSATVRITNLKHSNNETLDATVTGTVITKSFNSATGELTLTGPDSTANFQTVLESVTYKITGITAPNTETRTISFRVSDGLLQSNEAISEVKVIAPRISISASAPTESIPVGGSVTFNVEVTNNGGSNVDLKDIKVTSSDPSDNCEKSTGIPILEPGAKYEYTCQRGGVLANYDNVFTVTAEDVELETPVNGTSTASVRVVSPIVVDIFHMTGENTLAKGQDAEFIITIINPTGFPMNNISTEATMEMYDVDTESYLAPVPLPACSQTSISDLGPGEDTNYFCTVPDVQGSFIIEVDAAGSILLLPYTDFDSEEIKVPDLSFEVSADPFSISAGEPTLVKFTLTMINRSNASLTLSGLQSDRHGNLLTGQTNNTCPGITALPENVTHTCSYEAIVTSEPPSFINAITATADYAGGSLSVTEEAVVIAGDTTSLDVSLVANPSSLVAPGGVVNMTATVMNNTASSLLLDELNDSVLGSVDGLGNCDISQPIPANASYVCTYPVTISGKVPGDIVAHTVTAIAGFAQASDTAAISITTEIHAELYMSVVSFGGPMGNGTGNSACASVQIMTNFVYQGLADDAWDWYRFNISAPANVKIKLSNFLSEGHLLAYRLADAGDCTKLEQIGHIGATAGTILPNREIVLASSAPGTYFVAVSSTDAKHPYNTSSPYKLVVEAATP